MNERNFISYKGDCPNPEDFEKVQKNLERVMKMQKDFWSWKNNQSRTYIQYNLRGEYN